VRALSAQFSRQISVPEFPPAQAYPLFPEGSTRLIRSICHPLTANGIPYALPPNSTRLLQRAVRALNLSPPLPAEYTDHVTATPVSKSQQKSRAPPLTSLNPAVTGAIIVNNFEFCFHSPRVLLPPPKERLEDTSGTVRGTHRRGSIGASLRDVPLSFHLIALELSVPLASVPPEAPYMLIMSLPRCLHNSLKLRLFAPPSSRGGSRSAMSDFSSGISTTSTDDERWEVRTIPPLLAPARRRSNSTASQQGWADEEDGSASSSSPSSSQQQGSTGSSQGSEVVRGTFPSSERLIVRWAHASPRHPLMKLRRIGDSRKRVSLKHVGSIMQYIVRKPIRDGVNLPVIPVRMEFDANCRGIIHPGVETSLALDVVIDSFGSNMNWAVTPDITKGEREMDVVDGKPVDGKPVVTGWSWDLDMGDDRGVPPMTPVSLDEGDRNRSRSGTPSMQPSATMMPVSPNGPAVLTQEGERNYNASRLMSVIPVPLNDNRSNPEATLLRAPLPGTGATSTSDYSFENPNGGGTPLIPNDDDDISFRDGYFSTRASSRRSSMNSLAPSPTANRTRLEAAHPSEPFCVHIDLLPLLSSSTTPPKSLDMRFVVGCELLLSGTALDPNNIALPSIRIPTAESHTCNVTVLPEDMKNSGDLSVNAPLADAKGRWTQRLNNGGLISEVKVKQHKWSGSLSAVVDDDWADDCLALVLPEPKKHRPATSSPRDSPAQANLQARGSSPLEASPSSTTTMIRPGSHAGSPVTAPALKALERQYATPTRPGLPPADVAATPPGTQSPQLLQVKKLANANNRGSHSWVEILASPSPPSDSDPSAGYWSTILRVRVPWPSVTSAGGQRCDFGFLRPEGMKSAPKTELFHASIDGRGAEIQVFLGSTSGASYPATFGSPRKEAVGYPSDLEWLSFFRITDPEMRYGGTLEILYRVENPEVGPCPLEILLPTFTLAVSRLEITVADIPGKHQLLRMVERILMRPASRLPSRCGTIEFRYDNQVSSSISALCGTAVSRTAAHPSAKTV